MTRRRLLGAAFIAILIVIWVVPTYHLAGTKGGSDPCSSLDPVLPDWWVFLPFVGGGVGTMFSLSGGGSGRRAILVGLGAFAACMIVESVSLATTTCLI